MLSLRSGEANPPPQEGTFTRIGEKVAHIATTKISNLKNNIIAGASVFKDGFQTIGESRGRDDGTYETQEEKQASMERQNQAFDRIDATAKDALIKNIQAHKQIHEDIAHITEDVAGITVGAGKAGWEITKELGELLKTGARIGGAEMLYDSDVLSEQKEKYYASQQGKEDCELLIGTSKAVVNQTINTAVGTGKMVYHAGGLRGVEEQKNEDWSSLQELNERNIRLGIEQEKHSAGLVEGFDLALPATSHFIRNINDPNSENIGGNFAHAALETTSVIGSLKTAGALVNKTEKLAAQTLKGKKRIHETTSSKSFVDIVSEKTKEGVRKVEEVSKKLTDTVNNALDKIDPPMGGMQPAYAGAPSTSNLANNKSAVDITRMESRAAKNGVGSGNLPKAIHIEAAKRLNLETLQKAEDFFAKSKLQKHAERTYELTKKHAEGGFGTPMDLDNATAKKVLEYGQMHNRQIYGFFDDKVYCFQNAGNNIWHGYIFIYEWKLTRENTRLPTKMLKGWKSENIITESQYTKLSKLT